MEGSIVQQNNRRTGMPMMKFLKAIPNHAMLTNFIMLTICWYLIADWKVNVEERYASELASETGYFLFATVFPWLLYIVFFIIAILGCDKQFGNINWSLAFFIICVLWAFGLFMAACVIAGKSKKSPCRAYLCDQLKAASVFGFLSSCGLGFQGYCHYGEYKAEPVL